MGRAAARVPKRKGRAWVCLWADVLDDDRFAGVAASVPWLYCRLLLLCGQSGGGDVVELDVVRLAWRLRESESQVQADLLVLEARALVERKDSSIRIVDWFARQARETEAERSQRRRAEAMARERAGDDGDRSLTGENTTVGRDSTAAEVDPDLEIDPDGENKEEADTHACAQPPREREGAGTFGAASTNSVGGRRRSRRKSDRPELKAIFDAFCDGSGQKLVWGAKYVEPTEAIEAHGVMPEWVHHVARSYASSLSGAVVPSYARFAADFDRWSAERRRRMGEHSSGAGAQHVLDSGTLCRVHPTTELSSGRCEVCDGLEEFARTGGARS